MDLKTHAPFLYENGFVVLGVVFVLSVAYFTLRVFKILESDENYTEAEAALRKLERERKRGKSKQSGDDSDSSDAMDGREATHNDVTSHVPHDLGSNTPQVRSRPCHDITSIYNRSMTFCCFRFPSKANSSRQTSCCSARTTSSKQ